MTELKVAISIIMVLILASCGASHNFSKQKYTGLKKIEPVFAEEENELNDQKETFFDEGQESFSEEGLIQLSENEEVVIRDTERSLNIFEEEELSEAIDLESVEKSPSLIPEFSDEPKETITKQQGTRRIIGLTLLLLALLAICSVPTLILLVYISTFGGILVCFVLLGLIIGVFVLTRRIRQRTEGFTENDYIFKWTETGKYFLFGLVGMMLLATIISITVVLVLGPLLATAPALLLIFAGTFCFVFAYIYFIKLIRKHKANKLDGEAPKISGLVVFFSWFFIIASPLFEFVLIIFPF